MLAYLTGIGRFICFSLGFPERILFPSICVSKNAQLVKRSEKHTRKQLLFIERMVM